MLNVMMLLAQDSSTPVDPREIIQAAAAGDSVRLLSAVAFVLLALFLGSCGVVWKLIQKIEAERKTWGGERDKMLADHGTEVRKLYGDLLKLSMRVTLLAERLTNTSVSEDEGV